MQFLFAKDFGLIAKDCNLSGQEQACSRINRLFFRSVAVTMPMVIDCVLTIKAIGRTTFPDHERKTFGPTSLLHVVYTGSC